MQALSIYILIRLDEGETEQNNLDSLLLATVTVSTHCAPIYINFNVMVQILSKRFAHIDTTNDTQQALFNAGLKTEWENWLFKESSRRLDSYPLSYNGQNSQFLTELKAVCGISSR